MGQVLGLAKNSVCAGPGLVPTTGEATADDDGVLEVLEMPNQMSNSFARAYGVYRFIATNPANRGRRVRQLCKALKFQARGRLLHRRTVAPLGDRSLIWADVHSAGASAVVYANPPDPEMRVWRDRLSEGELFIDVGANVGTYSIWAAERGAAVLAVEPHPRLAALLRENVALNGYEDRVEVLEAACLDRTGTAYLTTERGSTTNRLASSHSAGVEVAAHTLDEIIDDREVAGVKVDVEGAERLVLEGARRALADGRIEILQLEWNECSLEMLQETREPIVRLLDECGYRLARMSDSGDLRDISDASFGPDVFALPRSRDRRPLD